MRTPRLVTESAACEAMGLPLATFRAWVQSGRLPQPLPDCGLYDVKALDAALDRVSGLGSPANALDAWRAKNARSA